MKVTVHLFAALREAAGEPTAKLELPEQATASDVLEAIAVLYPQRQDLIAASRLAINQQFASADKTITPGDELAVIPPVSGG